MHKHKKNLCIQKTSGPNEECVVFEIQGRQAKCLNSNISSFYSAMYILQETMEKTTTQKVTHNVVGCRHSTISSQLTLSLPSRMNGYISQGQIIEEFSNLHHGV